MTTLRREVIQTVRDILDDYIPIEVLDGATERITDSILSLRAFKAFVDKEAFDLKKADPAWGLFAGKEIKQKDVDFRKFEKEALDTFERDMGIRDNWNWYPAKSSEEKAWKVLREFVIEQYKKDPKCFQTYETWRRQPFSSGRMANLKIKNNPEDFPISWTDFLAFSQMYASQMPKEGGEVVDDGNIYIG